MSEIKFDEALALTNEKPGETLKELANIDKNAQFDMNIKTLLYYQNRVNNIADVATRFLSEARNKYNFWFDQHRAFLREYAIDHLKRGADGEIKGKSYKSISAGGGVFFRAKPEKITFDPDRLPALFAFLQEHFPINTNPVVIKTVYEITDKEALINLLQEIAEKRAKEILDNPEEFTVGAVQGLGEIYNEFGIEVEEADPFYHCYVGSTKGWTGRDLQSNLSQAVAGSLKYDQDEEIEILIEDLS